MADPPSSSKKVLSKKKVSNMLKSLKMSTPNMPPKGTPNKLSTDPTMDPQTDPQARYRSRFFVEAAHETTYAFFYYISSFSDLPRAGKKLGTH